MSKLSNASMLLAFEEVAKVFKAGIRRRPVRALNDLTLEVPQGAIVGLIGPNGSGKTTSFRIATGLLKPDSGKVRALGARPGSSRVKHQIGYMPEAPGFPGRLTPRELLDFIGTIFGFSAARRSSRIDELESLLALSAYLDRRMKNLSKGMTKRVGLASALFNQPKLLLLDEPFEGLDPIGAAQVKDHLTGQARQGTGILISSHVLSDVEALCNEIVVINEGSVILRGPTWSVLAARDRLQVVFEAPDREKVLNEIRDLIEAHGGTIESAGPPLESLESLFVNLLGQQGKPQPPSPDSQDPDAPAPDAPNPDSGARP